MDPRQARAKTGTPQEIVLLEESDLYRYHHEQQQQQQHQYHQQAYAFDAAPAVAQEKFGGFQQFGYAANGKPLPANTPYGQTSYAPTLDGTSEPSEYSRQYRLHSTPYGHSNARKPSLTSIDTIPITHGALRPGGAVDLFSRQYVGLLLNWTLVGFFNGSLSSVVAPVFDSYLAYSDYQSNAAYTLLNVPWLFKFLAGYITDCFPINRRRRKPYIYIGWAVFMVFMVAMAFMNEPRSAEVDENAASQGTKYVLMMMFGSLGHLMATVAVEGTMVEYAQREGEFSRGRTQSWCIIFRFIGEWIGALSVALALNSEEYGGTFAGSVPLQVVFGAHALLSACGLVITALYFHEDQASTTSQRLTTQFRRIWSIMQKKTTWHIALFGFFCKIASGYEIPAHSRVLRNWLGADSLTLNLNDATVSVGFIISGSIFMKFLLNTNWRKVYVVTVLLSLVAMIPVDIVTVFNVERDLTLYLSKAQIVSVLDAFSFILRLIVIIEVAEPGYEAVTYGILTTVFNLGSTVVSMLKNVVAAEWPDSITDTKLDTHEVRWHYMRAYIFKYGLRLVLLALIVWLLPRQKRHLKEMNLRGAPNLVIPIVLFLIFAGLFLTSVTSSMLALIESTSCLIFAGGSGCEPEEAH